MQTQAAAEEALADSRPFGDSRFLLGRVASRYRYRLELLSRQLGPAAELAASLANGELDELRDLRDPIVRVAIDSALANLAAPGSEPLREAEAVLGSVVRSVAADAKTPPLARGSLAVHGLRDDPSPWVWTNERTADDELGEPFRRYYSRYIRGLDLMTPRQEMLDMLAQGAALLDALCPRLYRSALDHVSLVAIVNTTASPGFTSLTTPAIPGLVVLAPATLTNPSETAAYLLHEAMHSKFVDLEHTHSLMASSYSESASPRIRPHWNRARAGYAPGWSLNRSLTVGHVYTSLALLYSRMASRPEVVAEHDAPDRPAIELQLRRSLDRADYLQQQLALHRAQLGKAGSLFVDWLGSILAALDPTPAPRRANVHLAMDLYDREAEKLQRVLDHSESEGKAVQPDWAKQVRSAGRGDIRAARRIVQVLRGDPALDVHLRSLEQRMLSLDESNAPFDISMAAVLAVRACVSTSLRSIAPLRYLAPDPEHPDASIGDSVLRLVENSGAHLSDVLLHG